jgi:quercetin dioxygenase-like cupin family protein
VTATAGTPSTGGAVARAADNELLVLGDGLVQLMLDASDTGGALSAHRCRLRDGAIGANPHRHTTASELFYVLAGTSIVLTGDRLVRATEGDLVVVPPHTPHAFAAAPKHDTELLVIITPGIERFEFFRDLARVRAGDLDPQSFAASQAQFDTYPADGRTWGTRRLTT